MSSAISESCGCGADDASPAKKVDFQDDARRDSPPTHGDGDFKMEFSESNVMEYSQSNVMEFSHSSVIDDSQSQSAQGVAPSPAKTTPNPGMNVEPEMQLVS